MAFFCWRVLLKFVVQALPIYRCLVQIASLSFIKELDAISKQFLRAGNLSLSKWSLVKWENICRLKQVGGLDLRQDFLTK